MFRIYSPNYFLGLICSVQNGKYLVSTHIVECQNQKVREQGLRSFENQGVYWYKFTVMSARLNNLVGQEVEGTVFKMSITQLLNFIDGYYLAN